jgi:hypothetical protein
MDRNVPPEIIERATQQMRKKKGDDTITHNDAWTYGNCYYVSFRSQNGNTSEHEVLAFDVKTKTQLGRKW